MADGIAQLVDRDGEGKVTRHLNYLGGMVGWRRRVAHGTDRDVRPLCRYPASFGGGKLVDTMLVNGLYRPCDVCSFGETRILAWGSVPRRDGTRGLLRLSFVLSKQTTGRQ